MINQISFQQHLFQVHCKSGQCLSPDLEESGDNDQTSGGDNDNNNSTNANNTSTTTITLPTFPPQQPFQLASESHRSFFFNPVNQQRFPRFPSNNPVRHFSTYN